MFKTFVSCDFFQLDWRLTREVPGLNKTFKSREEIIWKVSKKNLKVPLLFSSTSEIVESDVKEWAEEVDPDSEIESSEMLLWSSLISPHGPSMKTSGPSTFLSFLRFELDLENVQVFSARRRENRTFFRSSPQECQTRSNFVLNIFNNLAKLIMEFLPRR